MDQRHVRYLVDSADEVRRFAPLPRTVYLVIIPITVVPVNLPSPSSLSHHRRLVTAPLDLSPLFEVQLQSIPEKYKGQSPFTGEVLYQRLCFVKEF